MSSGNPAFPLLSETDLRTYLLSRFFPPASNVHTGNADVTLRVEWVDMDDALFHEASEQIVDLGLP